MPGQIADLAVTGDLGTDIFRRVDDRNQRRYRYECIATLVDDDTRLVAHSDNAAHHADEIFELAAKLQAAGFLRHRFALGEPASYPRAEDIGAPFALFLYLDFFRMWQIAEQEIARMSTVLSAGQSCDAPELSTMLRLLLDFNQIRRAEPLIGLALPRLLEVAQSGRDDKWQNAGFSLRMVGDLQMRAGQPDAALAAYSAAVSLGDNPHRRGLAIRAADAAGKRDETMRHLDAYIRRWPLTEPLEKIRDSLAPDMPGDKT